MPKKKTNRTVYKKFKVTGSGRVKRTQCAISHNTGKKSSKSVRQHRTLVNCPKSEVRVVKQNLPSQNIA